MHETYHLVPFITSSILKQVALGLEYLHNNDLVHRDIKSANLLVDFDTGLVKLADFGVSNTLLSNLVELPNHPLAGQEFLQVNPSKKVRRSFVGTPCWMAPEILLNQDYDTKIDIWSLGITAIELASGRPPFCEYDPITVRLLIILLTLLY